VHVAPKTENSSKVPDLDIVFAAKSVLVDVSGTDPLIPSLRQDVAGIPGHALGAKRAKYGWPPPLVKFRLPLWPQSFQLAP
jgi:hypothetical protein